MGVVYLLAFAAVIVLDYFISKWFSEAAKEKGYRSKKYFWICFCLGMIGYLLVIALPDHGMAGQCAINDLPEL